MEKDKVKDTMEAWKESEGSLKPMLDQMEEDFKMALGDQYTSEQKSKLAKEGRPAVVFNQLLKAVKLISGFQKQSRSDIKVFPVEGSDQGKADVYSQMLKWIFTNAGGYYHTSLAFENANIGGLGWIVADINYDDDPLNGDILITSESPFRILFDPYMKNPDLSDCSYILRRVYMPKKRAISIYPDAAEEIESMGESVASRIGAMFNMQSPYVPADQKKYVSITERWYRDFETKEFAIVEGQLVEITSPEMGQSLVAQTGQLDFIKRSVPVIRLCTTCNDKLIIQETDNPFGVNKYPFFPVFGYYFPDYNDWSYKVQGMIRAMKDPQREFNKQHSQLLAAILRMPQSGVIFEEGALNDEHSLDKPGGGRKIKVNPGAMDKVKFLDPPSIPQGLVSLVNLSQQYIREIGPNPDMLGMVNDQSSSRDAPGITVQLRQKQGITTIQDMFDNLSYAQRNLGKYLINMMNANFKAFKFSRILNMEIPPEFIQEAQSEKYDCVVDETANSPTYRIASYMVINQLIQSGMQIPGLLEEFIELADIPQGSKERLLSGIQQQAQMEAQMAQEQQGAPVG